MSDDGGDKGCAKGWGGEDNDEIGWLSDVGGRGIKFWGGQGGLLLVSSQLRVRLGWFRRNHVNALNIGFMIFSGRIN